MLQQYYSLILFSVFSSPTTANKISMIFVPFLCCADTTGSINVPCSTCIIRSLQRRFFSFSLSWYVFKSSCFAYLLALGLNTYTSKNAIWPAGQNPGAHTSNFTSFSVAVDGAKGLPVKGCNCDSTRTSLHTSLRSDDVMSLTKLCRNIQSHLSCKTKNAWSRIFHRTHNMRSQKNCFAIGYPSSDSGSVASQLDDPCNWFRLFSLICSSVR